MKLNMNDNVWVQLTDMGLSTLESFRDECNVVLKTFKRPEFDLEKLYPIENGYRRFTIETLILVFGPLRGCGKMFVNDCIYTEQKDIMEAKVEIVQYENNYSC